MNYADQPTRVGSVRLPLAPPLPGPLEPRWLWRSGKQVATWLGFSPAGVLVGSCDSSPDRVAHQIHALNHDTGEVRWCLDGLRAIGLCGEVLLTHEPGPRTDFVHAFRAADGRPLWQQRMARRLDTDYCVGRGGFYAWPRFEAPRGSRLTADFHPLEEPDRPHELDGPPGFYLEDLREHEGFLALYRWGAGPSEHVVYRHFQQVWSADRPGSSRGVVFPDSQGWVSCGLESTEAWSLEGRLLWAAPGQTRCWVGERWLVGEGPAGTVALDRSTGAVQHLALGRVRDLALAGDQVCWLNWEAVGTEGWTLPLAGLGGVWGRLFASRLVAYAGRLYLGGDDGSVACLAVPG